MPRFFTQDKDGNTVLLMAIDPKTHEVTYRADEETLNRQREKNTARLKKALEDLAYTDPDSPVFQYE